METSTAYKKAEEIIKENLYMTLATVDRDGAWTAPLWYAYADSVFYFISNIHSRHVRALEYEKNVSLSVFDSSLPPEEVNGVQIAGRCHQVKNIKEIAHAIRIFKVWSRTVFL